ncbi:MULTISPECIES: 3-hydroxyacyl-CoA dehydrogenase NAD-binding domain-containing protein [unclassified Sphingopyxis]|jgi:3-hydroxyacyl-CoA dehydrogenase|uniref:3-hydroxyacyl-CoA dehydrogenase NAD-binding domain-containing protein n=1 Tax=unclassified Sphingopyxis TaxID=2614943 RepID=UPI000731B0B9|nr:MULTISPECIES: 3-hydroxyacyl-CoA dehydrogenase NAD-binding domain-containing protein [unclassified Sphingopyxis]KTE23612.1 3-hydroxyacyl-CoA dehydrogenase [Sphingopyxis sp. H057]KTE50036.1 3-hydroxyacyl-CoA dehydrogenase [Sphingopyxis sp. H073]KTE53205.1 3-hydroxyacyl-CoA dehydrogenase [Sphingopyxis sp. H071]KTE59509.1 3-hydroxyacyl-CoA dehydrogenase [Sphingopyxis sp. H107]KTE63471.1 3-hydroxyacyl-CoA dehydrogenase [Sphingopyxis sp. H100]
MSEETPVSVTLQKDGDVAVVIVNNPPVNALSWHVRQGLKDNFEAALADDGVKAIVLRCDGGTFIAGADISEFGKPPRGPDFNAVLNMIEAATKPVVAAIHGTALGGGLETALVCHYRVAVPSAKLGVPEVKLGLLPGAGGTQRLPRVVGVEAAATMTSLGDPLPAAKAKDLGLVDALAGEDSLAADAIAFARAKIADGPRPTRERPVFGDVAVIEQLKAANAKRWRGFEAPYANLACVEAATRLPFDEGLAFERQEFMKLMMGSQSAAQRHLFFAERQAAKIDGLPKDIRLRDVKKVGIIGAGTMGGGIMMNFLQKGVPCTIVEMQQDALDRGLGVIRKNYDASAAKGRFKPEQVDQMMGLITPSLDLEALADCDLIIEAVYEDMGVKKEIFGKLDKIAKPGAILASNTSYLNIDEIAASTSRPGDVVGMHFFSPANVMKLLEVVRGEKTADDVLATAMAWGKKIGKVSVVAGVCHGFIGNRMLAPRQIEAQKLLLEGATPQQVDKVHTDFGMPMGPFQMSDLAGVDIGWHRDPNRIESIRDALCSEGRWGQKKQAGFYDYDEKRTPTPSARVEEIIDEFRKKAGIEKREITDQEIIERTLYPMVNEGALILEEGKAQRASDIDVVWVFGYGWPVYRGGPMFWAGIEGTDKIAAALEKHGFTVAPLLAEKAAAKAGF